MLPWDFKMSASQPVAVIGRYALYDEIASGGMATVHLGRLLGPVGFARTVAIKRLHQHYAKDPEFVSMFLDEARLAARIRHPNVVPTLDVVALSGELFLVMDYVHGVSLSRLTRTMSAQGLHIPIEISATVMVGALHGLHAAHEAHDERGLPLGIVHRDVSPQNVMVGSDGLPRVLDFGVAKASWRVQTTRDGQVKGKLSYMAPEQVNGGTVGPWTDVYAAGIVLWEALAGERLFKNSDSAALLARFTKNEPTRPPSTFNTQVTPQLDAVVLRALEAEPGQRYASAREMADALENAAHLASNSAVARWVQGVVHEELALHSALIAEIEQSSTTSGRGDPGSVRKMLASISEAHEPSLTRTTNMLGAPASEQSNRSQISMTRSPGSSQPPGPRQGNLYRVGAGVAALAGAIALLFVFTRSAAIPERAALPAAAAPALTLPGVVATVQPGAAPEPVHVLQPEDLPTAQAPPKPAPAHALKTAPAQKASTAAAPPPNCNPPYVVDSRGVRHMKLACLH